MDCVNHSGKVAVYYCQNCGKPLCLECTVSGALGHGAKVRFSARIARGLAAELSAAGSALCEAIAPFAGPVPVRAEQAESRRRRRCWD